MQKLVSVIVPVYNAESYIKHCLDSICSQTYRNLEIIVINDGSKDSTDCICQEYRNKDPRINYINKQNEGVSKTRNLGIQLAKGQYITFVDSDDYIEPYFIEHMLSALIQYKVGLVRCTYTYQGKIQGYPQTEATETKKIVKKIIEGTLMSYVYLLLIDINMCGKVYFKDNLTVMEDTVYYLELMTKYDRIALLNDSLYHHQFNENSILNNTQNHIRNMYGVVDANLYLVNILKQNFPEWLDLAYRKHFEIILAHTLKFYRNEKSINDVARVLKQLDKNSDFRMQIVKHVKFKNQRLQYLLSQCLLKLKCYHLLALFWKVIFLITKRRTL